MLRENLTQFSIPVPTGTSAPGSTSILLLWNKLILANTSWSDCLSVDTINSLGVIDSVSNSIVMGIVFTKVRSYPFAPSYSVIYWLHTHFLVQCFNRWGIMIIIYYIKCHCIRNLCLHAAGIEFGLQLRRDLQPKKRWIVQIWLIFS